MTYITGIELTTGNIFALKEFCILFDVSSLRGQLLGIFRYGEKNGYSSLFECDQNLSDDQFGAYKNIH